MPPGCLDLPHAGKDAMGPIKFLDETQAAYRFRYARYCLKWAAGLLLLPIALVALAPLTARLPTYAWFFLGFVMLFGLGGALLGAIGFTIGGWAAGVSSRFPAVDGVSHYIIAFLGGVLLAGLAAFSWHELILALQAHEIRTFQRHGSHLVRLGESPVAFFASVVGHGLMAVGVPAWLFLAIRKRRLARRTDARSSPNRFVD